MLSGCHAAITPTQQSARATLIRLLDESPGGDSGVCWGRNRLEKISLINSVEFPLLSPSLTSSQAALAQKFLFRIVPTV